MSERSSGDRSPRRAFQLPRARHRLRDDLRAEFDFHITERVEQLMAEGASRDDAEREVARRFGDYEAYLQRAQAFDATAMSQQRRGEFLDTLIRELRRAARALRRDHNFSLIALITLVLGLGATTAIFTVLDAVVLRPLPYHEADRLVSVMHPATVPGSGERSWGLSPGSYFGFRGETRLLDDLGVYRHTGFTVTNDGSAEVVQVAQATASLFTTFRAQPSVGRLFLPADDQPGAAQVTVLSHEFFTRRFGGDRAVVGRNLETSVGSFEIVGVAAPGLSLPMPGPFSSSANLSGFAVDVWLPLQLDPAGPFYNNHPYVGVGRLKPGVSVEAAQREFVALFARITERLPNVYSPGFLRQYNFRIAVAPLRDAVLGPTVPRALWMLFGAVALVLVIAAANVGHLFLLRFEARRREAAVRAALGAQRLQMAAHYLAETLLLCGAAAVAGVAVAAVALRALLAIAPTNIPRLATVTLGARAALVAVAVALALGIALGLVPLLQRGLDLSTLRDGGRGQSSSRRQRTARNALVVGQLALTLVLLATAGLTLRSFDQLRRVEPGFNPNGVLAFELSLPFLRYGTREKALAFHEALQRRIAALPGVTHVGGGPAPLEDFGTGCSVVFREHRPYGVDEQTPCVPTPSALPGYFESLGIAVQGRTPTWRDVESRSQASVVTRALADRLWPGEDPIGKGIASEGPDSPVWYRIVGVIPDLRAEALDQPPTEAVFYAPTGTRAGEPSDALNDATYFVRTGLPDVFSLMTAVRAAVRELDPAVPVENPRALRVVVAHSMARTSFILSLLGVAAGVALLLSTVGVFGVISSMVAQREPEIGIRLALGASPRQVVGMVVLQSVRLAAIGVALGLVGAYAAGGAMRALLYRVEGVDVAVLAAGTVLLVAAALGASWGPAIRAARVHPIEALRT